MDAVTRNYEIIGEAFNKIPQYVKDKYPEVPWKQMYGLRNLAVHEYHIIDPVILWEIARDHLPENMAQLTKYWKKRRMGEAEAVTAIRNGCRHILAVRP